MIENDIKEAEYFPLQEKILKVLTNRIGNFTSDNFFRLIIASNMCQLAGHMRAKIKDTNKLTTLINMYACGIMPSGAGKNYSQDIMDELILGFKNIFLKLSTILGDEFRNKIAIADHLAYNSDPDDVKEELEEEYKFYGFFPWRIGKGTEAAIRQARRQCQLAGCGALNVLVDEIGHNLINNTDLNALGLSLYDKGNIEASLTKVTKENVRYKERDIPIPVNFLWMGDPTRLFDSSTTEEAFMEFLSSGFARRMFFGWGTSKTIEEGMTAEQLFEMKAKANDPAVYDELIDTFSSLANKNYYNKEIELDRDGSILLCEYELWCKNRAKDYAPESDYTYSIELKERVYKTLRLAGAYAFIDKADTIKREHLLAAMKFAEDCGEDLYKILHQEKAYVKLAKFLEKTKDPLHRADLCDRLPFFKGSKSTQDQLIERAREWGYSHNITIKMFTRGKVEYLQGESYQETSLDKLIISISAHPADNYENKFVPFDKLISLGKTANICWSAHHFTYNPKEPNRGNIRKHEYVTGPFNLIVLDIDSGDTIASAKEVFKDNKYIIYTTKRHLTEGNTERFRIILPLKYTITLNKDDFKQFMLNYYESIPFTGLDEKTCDIARMWYTNDGEVYINQEGDLIDPRPYIPDTVENEQRKTENKKYGNIDAISRWFLQRTNEGNRNNMLFRYGSMLLDRGLDNNTVKSAIITLNSKLEPPLSINELEATVLKSIA